MNRMKRNCKMLCKGWALYLQGRAIKLDDEGVFIDAESAGSCSFNGFADFKTTRRFVGKAQTYMERYYQK